MEQQTGSKSGKKYVKAAYCHRAYLTYMQSTLCEILDSMTHSNIVRRTIISFRYADNTTLMAESEEELKSLLMKVKEDSEKAGLKLNIQTNQIRIHRLNVRGWQNVFHANGNRKL